MDTTSIEFVVGMAFVALYSVERINTPKINLDSTMQHRYWSMVGAYAATSVFVYFALTVGMSVPLIEMLAGNGVLPDDAATMSKPILIALILTVLLSKVPGLSQLDEALRREFHRRASMSSIAANISNLLKRKPLMLSDERKSAIVEHLVEQGFRRDDIVFEKNATVQSLWTRNAVLLFSLREWESESPYEKFVAAFQVDYTRLIERADKCEQTAKHCLHLCNTKDMDSELSSALKDCRRHYAEQLDVLLTELSDFMARGVATVSGVHADRRRVALQQIGLEVTADVGYTNHQIAFVMIIAFSVAILVPMLIPRSGPTRSLLEIYIFKIAAGYTIAALLALRYHHRDHRLALPHSTRPWGGYLTVGLLAALLTGVFGLVLDLLARRDLSEVFTRLSQWSAVYLIRPMVFGILIAYLIDTKVALEKLRERQWIEMGVTTAVMAVTSVVILAIFSGIKVAHPEYVYRIPDAFPMILSAAAIGAIIGYWLPTNMRRADASAAAERMSGVMSPAPETTSSIPSH